MGRSVNKVILIGNLGKDPEVKFTPQGTPVAKFSVATSERFKDAKGEWQERTEWHNIVAWQRLAEIAGEYLKKGRTVYIEGKIRTNSWEDKNTGEKKYRTEIIADQMVLLGGREGGRESTSEEGGQRARAAQASGSSAPEPRAQDEVAQTTITDEDIPF